MSATCKLNELVPWWSVYAYPAAEAIKKEPETPLKISYSLFPRLLESRDKVYTVATKCIRGQTIWLIFDKGDYEIPKMTPLKSVVAEQSIHDGFIPAEEKEENFANLATTTVKAKNDEIQKSHKDIGSVNGE